MEHHWFISLLPSLVRYCFNSVAIFVWWIPHHPHFTLPVCRMFINSITVSPCLFGGVFPCIKDHQRFGEPVVCVELFVSCYLAAESLSGVLSVDASMPKPPKPRNLFKRLHPVVQDMMSQTPSMKKDLQTMEKNDKTCAAVHLLIFEILWIWCGGFRYTCYPHFHGFL